MGKRLGGAQLCRIVITSSALSEVDMDYLSALKLVAGKWRGIFACALFWLSVLFVSVCLSTLLFIQYITFRLFIQ
jgi:hypothetical protein